MTERQEYEATTTAADDAGEQEPLTAEPVVEEPVVEEPVVERRRWGGVFVLGLLAFLVLSNATFGVLLYRSVSADRQERAITAVAERFAANLTTFSYRTLDADIAAIQQDATGSFHRQFDTALGGDVTLFREAIAEAQAESEGTIHGVTVTRIQDTSAQALVVADQAISNREQPEPRSVLRVLDLTLVRTAEGWKVDDVATRGGEVP